MALSRHHADLKQPLSVQELHNQAQNFDFSTSRPLRDWLRSARLLLTEAAACEEDGDLQMAYLYLSRYAELVIGKLPKHPEYKDAQYRNELAKATKSMQQNFEKLERWKPRIQRDHERYVRAVELRNAERQRREIEYRNDSNALGRRGSIPFGDASFEAYHNTLSANEHKELAVNLAHREIRRREAARQSPKRRRLSPTSLAPSHKDSLPQAHESIYANATRGQTDDNISRNVQDAARYLYRPERDDRRDHRVADVSTAHHYPTVPSKEEAMDWSMPALRPRSLDGPQDRAPTLPSKIRLDNEKADAPPLPPKADHAESTPSPPPSPTPIRYKFKPTAFTEGGAPLRPVFLPPDLRSTFLALAHPNTARNLETCGILCGTLISSALFISHLILPDQHSTADTCDTTSAGDTALFDYCDSANLLVCGWIHTHPTQTCFLSSRDVHTSAGYQVMMPEAIAIVCAPRHSPDWGVFRLTDPPGLPAVLRCEQKGLFHPHEERRLYTDALRPGHVVEGPGLKFEVVDLRKA